jgi:putative Holliday junction resolvase
MQVHSPAELLEALQPNQRLLGLDYGTKTIGLAMSDLTRIIASPLVTVQRGKLKDDVAALQSVIGKHGVGGLVIGYPRNMDGSEGPRCQATRAFVANIAPHIPLPVLLWDERLSTTAVTRTLLDADVSRARRAEVVDKMAASFILQGVLDALAHVKAR